MTARAPLTSMSFAVKIDGHDIGLWTSVSLGGIDVAVDRIEEGGNNGFVHQLPGRVSYRNLVLSRVFGEDSSKVAEWFASMTGTLKRSTGEICGFTSDGKPLVTWSFVDAIPVRWDLPDFTAGSQTGIVLETLELSHHGFTSS